MDSQILIGRNLKYFTPEDASYLLAKIDEIGRVLNGLLKSLDRESVTSH